MHKKMDLYKGKVLVTGGAGFIGSALIWALNKKGIDNILVSDFLGKDEKFKNLIPLKFDDYLEADALIDQLVDPSSILKDVSVVFHLGACSATTEQDCRYLIENNYEYTTAIGEWAIANNKRFVYASSAATYGNGHQGMDDKMEDISCLKPLNMYGYSKQLADLFFQRKGLLKSIVGLKYFNVFGPNEHHKGDMRSVVHKAFHQISQTGKVQLFKSYRPDYRDGEQERDFLYVKDAVDMTLYLAETPETNGLFNLGSGHANTWLSLTKAIFKAMNLSENIEFIEMPENLKSKYQYHTCADISKLRSTGYQKIITSLEDAVRDYIQNYLMSGKYLGD